MPRPVHPRRPARYRLPRQAVRVSTAAELRAALRRPARTAIVLANGTYSGTQAVLQPPRPPALRGETSAAQSSRAGSASVATTVAAGRCPRHRRRRPRQPPHGQRRRDRGVGPGRDARVLDTTVRGNGDLSAGVGCAAPRALSSARRAALPGLRRPHRRQRARRQTLRRPFRLTDVDVAGVAGRGPGSSNGPAEACVWIGNPGIVRRVRARSCAWSGVWTGTAAAAPASTHIDIDSTPDRRLRRALHARQHLPAAADRPRRPRRATHRVGEPGVGPPAGEHRQRDPGQPLRELARRRLPRRGHDAARRSAAAPSPLRSGPAIGDYLAANHLL